MTTTTTTITRPTLAELNVLVGASFDQYVGEVFARLAKQGLLLANPADYLRRSVLRELELSYNGPRSVHFGRLDDGAKFTYAGSRYVKLDSHHAACDGATPPMVEFDAKCNVIYDPWEIVEAKEDPEEVA